MNKERIEEVLKSCPHIHFNGWSDKELVCGEYEETCSFSIRGNKYKIRYIEVGRMYIYYGEMIIKAEGFIITETFPQNNFSKSIEFYNNGEWCAAIPII